MSDNPRIDDLRRRVQQDPASIAFAQLAEEYRRARRFDESVSVCRAGLTIHPAYTSARVTLGRALVELGQLEEARAEFAVVLRAAPGNLAAIRGMADLCERLGLVEEALSFYKSALSIAHNDPELEESVGDLSRRLVMRPGPAVSETSETSEPLPPEPPPMVLFEPMDPERAHAERTIAALELWLDAIHGTRAY